MDVKFRRTVEPWAPAEEAEPSAAEDRDPRSRFLTPWQPRRPSLSLFPEAAMRRR